MSPEIDLALEDPLHRRGEGLVARVLAQHADDDVLLGAEREPGAGAAPHGAQLLRRLAAHVAVGASASSRRLDDHRRAAVAAPREAAQQRVAFAASVQREPLHAVERRRVDDGVVLAGEALVLVPREARVDRVLEHAEHRVLRPSALLLRRHTDIVQLVDDP